MTSKLTNNILTAFERDGGNSILHYAQNTEKHTQELNESIVELGEQGIYPQLTEAEEGFVALKFIKVLNGQRKYNVKVDTGKELFNVSVNGDTEIFFN